MRRRLQSLGRIVTSLAAVAVVTAGYARLIPANPTTIALSYVVVILLIATGWGIGEATAASVAAMLCFNFFFLPPVGTLTIADPQNWVAFVAFLLTAIIASQLSGRARQRDIEAVARQRDLERLYALSRALLLSDGGGSVSGAIARHIADAFELQAVGLYDQRTDTVSWAGSTELPALDGKLREVARRATSIRDPAGLVVIAIQLGGAPIGSLAIMDVGAQRHGAALDRESGGDRARAGALAGSHGARRGRAAERRVARDRAGCAGPRVQDAAHVDEGGDGRSAGERVDQRPRSRTGGHHRRRPGPVSGAGDRCGSDVANRCGRLRRASRPPQSRGCRGDDVTEVREASRWSRSSPAGSRGLDGRRRSRVARTGASTVARQRAEILARRHRPSRSRREATAQWTSSSAIPARRFQSASRRGSSSASIAARRPATFREPGWASRSCSRLPGRTEGP